MENTRYQPDLSFSEKLILFQYKVKRNFFKTLERLKIRISLIIIPHNEKNVIKIEFSGLLLLFLLFLLVTLVILSSVYLIRSTNDQTDHRIFEEEYQNRVVFLHYNEMADELEESLELLSKNSEDLNQLAWEKYLKDSSITRDYIPDEPEFYISELKDTLHSNMNLYQQSVIKISYLSYQLKRQQPVFQNAMDYLNTRESIFQSMPRGRPLSLGIGRITSTYGERTDPFGFGTGDFHNGVDFAAGERTPIYATAPGIVSESEHSEGGLGKSLRIDHENGFYTLYGHCSLILVTKGMKVKRGDKVALVGATGKATGSHLHYEVHIGMDPPMDPKEFINIE